jgi:hypothetical protein
MIAVKLYTLNIARMLARMTGETNWDRTKFLSGSKPVVGSMPQASWVIKELHLEVEM